MAKLGGVYLRARFIVSRRTLVHRLPSGKTVGRQGGATGFILHQSYDLVAQATTYRHAAVEPADPRCPPSSPGRGLEAKAGCRANAFGADPLLARQ